MSRSVLLSSSLLLMLVAAGCAGKANRPVDQGRERAVDIRGGSGETGPFRRDLPSTLCLAFAKEGQSCATQACPPGLISAILDGKNCTCHVPCNPDQNKRCQPEVCGRVCVQLTDSGQPLPGQGACLQDKGNGPGEPCPPSCRQDLNCILHGEVSFCRQSCTGPADCLGYKMVCVPLSSTEKVCVPGGSTTGPKQGESCAASDAYCIQGLLCDPQSKICLKACTPSSGCTAPAACTKLQDPATGIVIGYGCR